MDVVLMRGLVWEVGCSTVPIVLYLEILRCGNIPEAHGKI